MKKKTWLRILESFVFVLLLAGMLAGLTRLMQRKASTNQFGSFFDEPQQFDVLFFGDSSFVNCLFPMELWEDYGITGFNLSCYGNTIPVSYWSMMNALDYAQPKVIVAAVNDARKDLKVTGSSSDVHTAFDFYPLSRTKIRAIEDLMDDPEAVDDEGNRYSDMKWEYYFTLGKYHSRWSELTKYDITGMKNVHKGAEMRISVAPAKDYNIIDDDCYDEETGVGYEYLRRMIEECQARGIELLLVHTPYPASENAQMSANTAGSIADEYGVNYIDFVRMDSVTDYAVDCYDDKAHLNPSGGLKVTDYIGQFLAEGYGLEDHRGDEAYANWDKAHAEYAASKREMICAQDKLENLLMMLHDDSVSAVIAVRGQAELYWNDQLLTLLHNTDRAHVYDADAYSMWSNSMYPLSGLDEAVYDDAPYLLELDRSLGETREYVGGEAVSRAEALFGENVWEEGREVRIRVMDRAAGDVLMERQF